MTKPTTVVPDALRRPYKYLRLEWRSDLALLRVRTCVKPIQCYSLSGIAEMQRHFLSATSSIPTTTVGLNGLGS